MGTYYDPAWIATAWLGWRRGASSKVEAMKAGLDGGITLIDTAEIYGAEPLVAKAIKGKKREEIFIATKVWSNHLKRDALVRALDRSLRRLGLSYVDLYQVHFPNSRVPISETMAAMEEMKEKGKLLHIGVSNFSLRQLVDANSALKKSQVASNQVQYSLEHRDPELDLIPYCESNKISILAYYPLGHGKLASDKARDKMAAICEKYSKTPAQVALNWLVSKPGVFAIPRASRADHVKEDIGASGWSLPDGEKAELERAYPLEKRGKDGVVGFTTPSSSFSSFRRR
ncbi:MAG: aldo/keto reductase [Thaumarchaeota archaeon]|nr:aldo/keto reductase [Nitrososphaerota archaeon]